MSRDVARERVRATVGEELVDSAEAEAWTRIGEQAVWQADVVALPRSATPDAASMLIVTAGELIVHGEPVPYHPGTAEERATVLAQGVSAAARAAGRLPERLEVRDAEAAALLAPRPQLRGVQVSAAPLPQLDEAMKTLVGQMEGASLAARIVSPDTWRETGASAGELADFHRAATELYRLAPWKDPAMHVPLLLHLPGEERAWGASVMGDAGMAFGLALYSDPLDLLALMVGPELGTAMPRMLGYGLTVDFDRRDALTAVMQREITAAGWPVAGPRAYPRLFALNTEEGRVTADHVRKATLAVRGLTVFASDGDPEEEVGVQVLLFPFPGEDMDEDFADDEDDDEDGVWLEFGLPRAASPILPEGPGADPAAALRGRDDHEALKAAEEARHARFEAWLPTAIQTVREVDRQNARHWTDHLVGMAIPAGAFTEYDLRLFLYDLYVRTSGATKTAIRAMPELLPWIFRFLEEEEGIRYPFAESVLSELRALELQGRELGLELEETLAELGNVLYTSLDDCEMLHRREAAGGVVGWPDMMNREVAELDRELQRRWLLWHDEAVLQGTVGWDDLEITLVERQVEWENTPHPAYGGRTPAEVVRAWTESEQYLGMDQRAMMEALHAAGE